MSDSRKADAVRHGAEGAAAFDPAARVHCVCATCNNTFETDAAHFDAKQCPACRRDG